MPKPLSLLNGVSDLVAPSDQPTGLFVATRRLTHAEFIALPSTPVEIVPAPGAGTTIVPFLVTFARNFAVAYDAGAEFDQLFVAYDGASPSAVAVIVNAESPSAMYLNAWLTQNLTLPSVIPAAIASVFGQNDNWGSLVLNTPVLGAANQALKIALLRGDSEEDAWGGGDAANTLDVTVFYFLIPA